MKKSKKQMGFTLVEIMIVVVIMGLLAAMGIPAFQKVREHTLIEAEKNRLKAEGVKAPQVIVVSKGINTILRSPTVGNITVSGGKIKWTDDKGVSHEHTLDADQSFQIR